MTLALSPFLLKRDIRASRLSVNFGRLPLLAKPLLAVAESLRPSLTVHDGLPT